MRLCLAFILSLCLNLGATITPGFPDKLVWNPSPAINVTYQVLRGTGSNTWVATNSVGPSTNYTILGVDYGIWWFAVRAVSTNGVFSDLTPSLSWTNRPDPPTMLTIQSTSSGTADIWVPLPFGASVVESSPDAAAWSPFVQVKNLSPEPTRTVGIRVETTDPRRFYRAPAPILPASIRIPPSP